MTAHIHQEDLEFLEEAKVALNGNLRWETYMNDGETHIALRDGADRDCVRVYRLSNEVMFAHNVLNKAPKLIVEGGENKMTEKQQQIFSKIDRKAGEFRHNDILMTDSGPIIVMRPSSFVPYRGGMVTVDELYQQGKIEGIYPVESFVSFEDGESDA